MKHTSRKNNIMYGFLMNHYKYKFQIIKYKHDTHNPSELRSERRQTSRESQGQAEAIVTRD